MASIRYDDGGNVFASNCFPVRCKFGQGYDGGAWLVAQRAEQRRRFKAILCTKPRTYSRIREERKKSERMGTSLDDHKFEEEEDEADNTPTLDGFFLMKHCCVEDPSDVCSINISGKELSEVKEEDLALFDNVVYVNAAENYLPFEAFHGFSIMRELEMPLNGLRSLKIDVSDYPHLELLDLSYNNLSAEDVLSLGLLRNLKVLHLTGNNFKSLPMDMALPYIPDPAQKTRHLRYPKLEVLMLDDNKLSDVNVFAALAGLQRLHHLNLEKNDISYVPQLKSVEGKVVTAESKISMKKSKLSSRGSRSSRRSKSRASNSARSSARQRPSTTPEGEYKMEVTAQTLPLRQETDLPLNKEVIAETEKETEEEIPEEKKEEKERGETPVEKNTTTEENDLLTDDLGLNLGNLTERISELNVDEEEAAQKEKEKKAASVQYCPFPELRYLNLAHNQFSDEEALLAVAAWPELVELVIHNNPLTTTHSGDPPLLKRFLGDRLGIKFVRKEEPSLVKPSLEVQPKKHRQVSTIVPKVPKPSVEERLMLEAPPIVERPAQGERTLSSLDLHKPLPPIESKASPTPSPRIDAWTERREDTQDNEDAFFMTQVEDQEEEAGRVERRAEEKSVEKVEKKKMEVRKVEEKYRGYEMLLDVDSDQEEEFTDKPRDIQGNIRSLKYMLNHGLVYRDASVELNRISRPVKEYRRIPVPPAKPKSQAEKIDDALVNLRTRTTVNEAGLEDVLTEPKKYKKQFPEALTLLNQIQRRYNVVRVSSMKEARDARKHLQGAADEIGKANKQLDSLRKKGVKVCD